MKNDNFFLNPFLFKERLKAKRSKENSLESDIPLFTDPSELQPYFLKEVQASDDLLMNGLYFIFTITVLVIVYPNFVS